MSANLALPELRGESGKSIPDGHCGEKVWHFGPFPIILL